MICHVTDLDQLIWYRKLEGMTTEDLVARLRREAPANDAMLRGTAWHKILEDPPPVLGTVEMHGFTFRIDCDATIELPQVREIRATKTYDVEGIPVTLTGGCDGITGNKVTDHKLTFRPAPENYFQSYQWRAYLDIYGADSFRYYLYHAKDEDGVVVISEVSTLEFYRYPGMEDDLMAGISDMVNFCKEYLPERFK